jgi:hypothetical protein
MPAEEETAAEEETTAEVIPPVVIAVQTSSYGDEFSWEITSSGEVVCSGDSYDSHALYEVLDCELEDGAYVLNCIDTFGDGWHGGHVTIEGNQYCGDFNKSNGDEPGYLMTQPFDIARSSNPLDVVVQTSSYGNEFTWEITSADVVVCSGGPYASSTTYDSVGCVIADGDYTLNCIDSYGDGWHGGSVTIRGH